MPITPDRDISITNLVFPEGPHSSNLLIFLSTGDIKLADLTSDVNTLPTLYQTVPNQYISLSKQRKMILAVSELGSAELLEVTD